MKINLNDYSNAEFSENDSAIDLISEFGNLFPEIATFYFTVYTPKPNIEDDVNVPADLSRQKSDPMLFIKKKRSFEESLVSNVSGNNIGNEMISRLIFHDEKKDREDNFIAVPKDKISQWTAEKEKSVLNTEAIGITSTCETADHSRLHIPMMDFACPVSDENLNFIKRVLRETGYHKGIILNSGRSYHFYGLELLTEKEWFKFMGKCMLLSPFTDSRFIAHRVISGRTILRINHTTLKPQTPGVIAFI